MAVPSSGAISIQDLVDEFGGSTPHSISEYYRAGPLVPNVPTNSSIPESGTVTFSDYYGAVNASFISATGGSIATSGDYKVHTFTSAATFTVNDAGNSAGSNSIEYLTVGGGGGSAKGGGAGGGFRTNYPSPATGGLSVSATGYPIAVGAAGAPGGTPNSAIGANGGVSTVSSITSAGGGGGATYDPPSNRTGLAGASGGGGANGGGGGAGNTPPTSPSQGNAGGSSTGFGNGAGGGATSVGGNAVDSPGNYSGGSGGNGTANSITGSPVTYAGGGGGSLQGGVAQPAGAPQGGSGGGGNGAKGKDEFPAGPGPTAATAGTNGLGGGGGGGTPGTGTATPGVSGSGVVIIRYKFQ